MKDNIMTTNEKTIQQLKNLVVTPHYSNQSSSSVQKINLESLNAKAQRVSENLDHAAAIIRPQ